MIPLRDTIPSRHTPIMTWSLILCNVAVFYFEVMMPRATLSQVIWSLGVVPDRRIILESPAGFYVRLAPHGAHIWSYFTSLFLHGGLVHLISNMWALWIFGDNVEDRMGPRRFLLFYLLCGAFSGAAHAWMNPLSQIPTIGASGAIAGVLGAYFVMYPRSQVVVLLPILFFPFFFLVPAVLYLFFWFFSQLFSGAMSLLAPGALRGVAWWAHVAGFVAGIVLHPFFARRRARPRSLLADEYGVRGAWTRF